MWKPSSPFALPSALSRARAKFTARGKSATAPSSNTETAKSAPSAWKKPSFCLQLACLALSVSAYLALVVKEEGVSDETAERLLARGWRVAESRPCEGLHPGTYYELDTEKASRELYVTVQGEILTAGAAWPDGEFHCRPISTLSFVEEIE